MAGLKYLPGDVLHYSLDSEGNTAGHNVLVLPDFCVKAVELGLSSYSLLVLGGPTRGSCICPLPFDVHCENSVSKIAHVDLTNHLIEMSSFKLTLDEIIKLVPDLQQHITDPVRLVDDDYVEWLD